MTNKIIVLAAAACGITIAASASAMPLNPLRSDSSVDQVRMVCDEYGRCWRETNPAEDIARGVIRGLEGRSIYRHRDWAGGIAIGIVTTTTKTKASPVSHNSLKAFHE
jgi:hypothetical protein